jgi:hypothetical protein
VLAFDGSRVLESANKALQALVEHLPQHRAAVHARIALAEPLTRAHKVLAVQPERGERLAPAHRSGGEVHAARPEPERAKAELEAALTAAPDVSADTLGHVDFNAYTAELSAWLEAQGDRKRAGELAAELVLTLSRRGVPEHVLAPIRDRAAILGQRVAKLAPRDAGRGSRSPSGGKKR